MTCCPRAAPGHGDCSALPTTPTPPQWDVLSRSSSSPSSVHHFPGSLSDTQKLRPHSSHLTWNLHFHRVPLRSPSWQPKSLRHTEGHFLSSCQLHLDFGSDGVPMRGSAGWLPPGCLTDQLCFLQVGQICREKAWTHKERGGEGGGWKMSKFHQ